MWQSRAPVSWTRWWWLSIPALGLVEWSAHATFRAQPPQPGDWDTLAPEVLALRQAEELVVVAPYWAEPHARRVLGDEAMPLAQVARPEDARYGRAIEISILGQDSELRGWTVQAERQVGKFRLRELANPNPDPPRIDLVDWLTPERASAHQLRKGKPDGSCEWTDSGRVRNGALHGHPTFPKRRFECSKEPWNFVGVTVIEDENYRPRRCIWAHPARGRQTVVRFDDVPLGSKIVGYAGLPYFLEREKKGDPVEMEVWLGGDPPEQLGDYVHHDGEGWKRFEFSTAPYAGESRSIEFRTRANDTRKREFCFQADVR